MNKTRFRSTKGQAVLYTQFLDIFHPIGSYYITTNSNTDPNIIFLTTTWKKLELNNALIVSGGLGALNFGNKAIIKQENIKRSYFTTYDNAKSIHTHHYWPSVGYNDDRGVYAADAPAWTGSSTLTTWGTNQGCHTHTFKVGVDNPIPIDFHKGLNRVYCYIWERIA